MLDYLNLFYLKSLSVGGEREKRREEGEKKRGENTRMGRVVRRGEER